MYLINKDYILMIDNTNQTLFSIINFDKQRYLGISLKEFFDLLIQNKISFQFLIK